MSGVFGYVDLTGATDVQAQFDRMAVALRAASPGVSLSDRRVAIEGGCIKAPGGSSVALGRLRNDAAFNRLPASSDRTVDTRTNGRFGRFVYTGLARLDDRRTLVSRLGLSPGAADHDEDDVGLLMRAFARLPDPCLDEAYGDWSLAVWDPTERRLTLTREPYGYRPLYYTENTRFFAFCSALEPLLKVEGIDRSFDDLVVARTLVKWSSGPGDTAFASIRSLPPGCTLSVGPTGRSEVRRYWHVRDRIRGGARHSPKDAASEVRRLLDVAVQVRCDAAGATACTLSAGLDSGVVTGLAGRHAHARDRSIAAYCVVPRFPERTLAFGDRLVDESSLARTIGDVHPNVDVVTHAASDISPLEGIAMTVEAVAQPFYAASNDAWMHSMMRRARSDGAAVLLNAGAGNFTFSWGELRTQSIWRNLATGHPRVVASRLRWALDAARSTLPGRSGRLRSEEAWIDEYLIAPEYAQRLDLAGRLRDEGFDRSGGFDPYRFRSHLETRLDGLAFEHGGGVLWDMHARTHGLDVLDPTADTRLMLFCLGLPDATFTGKENEPRWLAREVARELVHESVRLNRRRGLQAADLLARLRDDEARAADWFVRMKASPAVVERVDVFALEQLWQRVLAASPERPPVDVWKTAWAILFSRLCVAYFLLRFS